MASYPLATSTWGEEERQAIQDVVNHGRFTMGDEVAGFEREFAQFVGSRYAVMVNSGSSANLLAVAAQFFRKQSPLHPGDEVIVPAVSWSTTYFPLHQYDLKVKFVDVDRETLNYDLRSLSEAVTDDTRVIMCVDLLGNPNDYIRIDEIIGRRPIQIMEDSCESMGATFNGRSTGTFGSVGTFSTFFSHHIATMEGGLVVTDDEELYHILLSLRSHGWTRHLPDFNLVTGQKSKNEFEECFKFVLPGYNVRPVEMSGAIGREQLKKLPGFLERRKENARIFRDRFGGRADLRIQTEIGQSSWFGFSFLIEDTKRFDRDRVVSFLAERGIETRPINAGNFVKNPAIEYFDYVVSGELRNADAVDRQGFFVGNHHYDIRAQIDGLAEALEAFR